jgi:hypothetical protein
MKFDYASNTLLLQPYKSAQYTDWSSCIVFGIGSTKLLGDKVCFRNPVVNLLPLQNQLWLTIDTEAWGRIDPETLETIEGKTKVDSTILNAHPACEPAVDERGVRKFLKLTPLLYWCLFLTRKSSRL